MTAERVRLTEATAILARAHDAYVEALSNPLRGTVGTEADLRAANGEREDVARETMFDCLYDLQPAHVASIIAALARKEG